MTSDDLAARERELRIDAAAAYRLVARNRWDDLIFTHISSRLPGDPPRFLMNPLGSVFSEITASSLVAVDETGAPVTPNSPPIIPAGFVIHGAIHAARDDAHCIIHLHTPAGQAVSALAEGLLPVTQTALLISHDLAYHDFEGVATDLDERERLVRDLGDRNLMILRNHGTLTVGRTMAQAWARMHFLERACQAQVLMGDARSRAQAPSASAQARTKAESEAGFAAGVAEAAWAALLRELDRLDQSYRN